MPRHLVPSLPASLGLCFLAGLFKLRQNLVSRCSSPAPSHWREVAMQIARPHCSLLGRRLGVPKAVCMSASLQGHNGDHAWETLLQPVYPNICFLGLPTTGLDSRLCRHLNQAPLGQPQPPLPNGAISRFPGQVIPTGQALLWSGSPWSLIHPSSSTPQLAVS